MSDPLGTTVSCHSIVSAIKGFPQASWKRSQNGESVHFNETRLSDAFKTDVTKSRSRGSLSQKSKERATCYIWNCYTTGLVTICQCWICLQWSLIHEKEICVRSPLAVTAPLSLTTSSVVLFYCCGGPTERGILGDVVHDTIPGPGLRLHRLGLEEISGDRRWLSLGNAVLETGVAQICHEGFSITVAHADSCLAAPWLGCLKHKLIVFGLSGLKC